MSETFRMESWDQLSTGIKRPLLLSIAVTGVIAIFSTIFYFFAQPSIPLFYSLPRSEQALAVKEWLFLFPVFSLTMTLVHSLLISLFKELDRLVIRLFVWMTVVMQFFLFVTLVRIILITS